MLRKLPRQCDHNVIVGFENYDDAGVYRVATDLALVQTVDFFPPLVDDPFAFGQIAATNALSDVYAMGGRPITSLALVCFPERDELNLLGEIMAGGLSKMHEAGCTVIGGHSVRDTEIKFGYSVTGLVHPDRVLTNSAAKPGDKLILTKAIGTGAITTAVKKGHVLADRWIKNALKSMTTLNKLAVEVIANNRFSVHALTDVTGFGLAGHAREMASASKVQLRLYVPEIPVLEGAVECVDLGFTPGGTSANKEFAEREIEYVSTVSERTKALLFDPQTAGGLLISVGAADSEPLLQELQKREIASTEIGDVVNEREFSPARVLIV